MRAPHTEPDRDGDALQGLHVALLMFGAVSFSAWFELGRFL